MKKYLIAAMIMAVGASVTFAQPRHKDGMKKHDGLKTALSLNDEQYASIKDVNKKFHQQQMALRRDSTLTKEQRISERKRNMYDRDEAIKAVLTPDQQTKWEAIREKRKANVADRKAQWTEAKKALDLTEEQQAAIKESGKEMHHKLKALRKESKDADRAEIKKIKDEHNAKIKSILSEDQYEKWNELRTQGRHHFKKKRH